MSYTAILILGIALSIDACIASFSYGLKYDKEKLKNSFLLASFTGIFQGFMPCIGYYLTSLVKEYIQPYTSSIVFLIFTYLGIKFIIESSDKKKANNLCIDLKCLFLIGIATSIDAFSAGIYISLTGSSIFIPALIIAIITFVNSTIGFYLGNKIKDLNTQLLEIFAGLLLIFLAFKSVY